MSKRDEESNLAGVCSQATAYRFLEDGRSPKLEVLDELIKWLDLKVTRRCPRSSVTVRNQVPTPPSVATWIDSSSSTMELQPATWSVARMKTSSMG